MSPIANMRRAQKFFHAHKQHCLAVLSVTIVFVHYLAPEVEVHVTAIVGIICAECS
ncbi:hypothetical protein [Mesorhizobium sp.]|uniref:hypothetical protein n=1 Tax=Mesorhizobium sp. TaxID=1871066 RepID=UPI0025BC95E9|nr:hypothetical protein [Mesorhizobium sp.]